MCLHCLPNRPAAFATALLVLLAGCGRAKEPAPEPARPAEHVAPPPPAVAAEPEPAEVPFDAPQAEFDTVETPVRRLRPPAERPAPPSAERPPPAPPPAERPPSERPPGTSEVAGSCDARPAEAFCFTYVGADWTSAAARAHCARAPGARFSPGPCPTADRVGTCLFVRAGAAGESLAYEYYAPYPTDLARLACPGTFTASQD